MQWDPIQDRTKTFVDPDVEEEGNRDKAAWVQQSGQLITNAAGA